MWNRSRRAVLNSLRQISKQRRIFPIGYMSNFHGYFNGTILANKVSYQNFHSSFAQRSILDEGDEAIVFTCEKCNTEQAQAFSTEGMERGVVTLYCVNCKTNYCIADNLGWYDDPRNMEEFLANMGPYTQKRFEKKFELTIETLKELGIYEKTMERKAITDKKKAEAEAAQNAAGVAPAEKKE
jgi:hypothetical protein